jgi:hypothetical protein
MDRSENSTVSMAAARKISMPNWNSSRWRGHWHRFSTASDGVVAHLAGPQAKAAEEITLAVAGADFLDGIEGFGQRLGEARVLSFSSFFRCLTRLPNCTVK